METTEHEADDLRQDDEQTAKSSGEWNRPLLLAGLGLVLMLGGYAAMNYVPPSELTPRQAEQERLQSELRELASKQRASGVSDEALADRVEQIKPPRRTSRYEIPGRLAIFLGLFLFVAAGVLMYRQPTPKREGPENDSQARFG
jgi:hypothetical protein